MDYSEEEIETIWCPMCKKRGYLVQLGPKILMPNEPRPDDYDHWLECSNCMWLCPIHIIPDEATVKDAIEKQETPFESKPNVESAHKRRKIKLGMFQDISTSILERLKTLILLRP